MRFNIPYININFDVVLAYIDYFFPREVTGPLLLTIVLEILLGDVLDRYAPPGLKIELDVVLLVVLVVVVAAWGEADDDMAELEEELEGKQMVEREEADER